jgi:hypothetical protein
MLSLCCFPSTSAIFEQTDERLHSDEMNIDDTPVCERDEDIEIADDDDVAQDLREEASFRDDAEIGTSSSGSCFIGDFSVFRDIFLAAFSDGYYKVC